MADEVITSEKPQLTQEQMIVHDTGEYAMLFDSAKFNQAYRVATAFAQSGLVPDHFKNNPAGVFVVLHMATRMNLDPFMVLQKTYMVHGRPGMEAQLVIALVNARGPFTGPIQWRFEGTGKDRKCVAYATHAKTGELCEAEVTWAMVEAEGWNKDKQTQRGAIQKSKWNTLEQLMFRYRSGTFLARLYCPEVIMGLSTADELEDSILDLDAGVTVSHKPRPSLPEAPVVDPEAVAAFGLCVGDETTDESVYAAVDQYISEIAKVNKTTTEAVKAQAGTPENFPAFWKSFLNWQSKHEKKRGRKPATPEPQGEAKEEEFGQSTVSGQDNQTTAPSFIPRGITAEQLDTLRKAPADLLADAFMEVEQDMMDLAELDTDTAATLIAWLAKQ